MFEPNPGPYHNINAFVLPLTLVFGFIGFPTSRLDHWYSEETEEVLESRLLVEMGVDGESSLLAAII